MTAPGHAHRDNPMENLLEPLAPDTRLFRFIRSRRFLELLSSRRIVLCRPRLWDDPFENFLSKTTVEDDGDTVGFNLTNDFFGQCWTLQSECDGLWRNYCALEDGVRIETTAGKLIRAIWNTADRFASLRTFVGKVDYLEDDQLRDMLQGCLEYGHWLTDSTGKGMARVLLVKRIEFAYDHEVRALISEPDHTDDIKAFPIVPKDFIDTVMFAPKMNDTRYTECIDQLRAASFPDSRVSRSELYDPWILQMPKEPP
jgi:hypothetical protein